MDQNLLDTYVSTNFGGARTYLIDGQSLALDWSDARLVKARLTGEGLTDKGYDTFLASGFANLDRPPLAQLIAEAIGIPFSIGDGLLLLNIDAVFSNALEQVRVYSQKSTTFNLFQPLRTGVKGGVLNAISIKDKYFGLRDIDGDEESLHDLLDILPSNLADSIIFILSISGTPYENYTPGDPIITATATHSGGTEVEVIQDGGNIAFQGLSNTVVVNGEGFNFTADPGLMFKVEVTVDEPVTEKKVYDSDDLIQIISGSIAIAVVPRMTIVLETVSVQDQDTLMAQLIEIPVGE